MKQIQVIVFKDKEGNFWFTGQIRKVYLFLRTKWKDVEPICTNSYDNAVLIAGGKKLIMEQPTEPQLKKGKLPIPHVVGRSKQLFCPVCGCNKVLMAETTYVCRNKDCEHHWAK